MSRRNTSNPTAGDANPSVHNAKSCLSAGVDSAFSVCLKLLKSFALPLRSVASPHSHSSGLRLATRYEEVNVDGLEPDSSQPGRRESRSVGLLFCAGLFLK